MLIDHEPAIAAAWGLGALLSVAVAVWLASVARRDAGIVDSAWSLMILLAGAVYAWLLPEAGPRAAWLLPLVALWALRLAGHITWRNWGEPEDRRYREIRARNQPHYEWKSLYLVFGLQAVLAWIVSMPLLAALSGQTPLNALDAAGIALFAVGFVFEAVADWQLARFMRDPANAGLVMNRGLWRYTRHPNYFGEFCVWWGFGMIALGAGGSWAVVSPLLMTLLLLKVSGVGLLEKDIAERRPAYRDYRARTNAFFPGLPRRGN